MFALAVWLVLSAQAPASSCGEADDPAFATTRDHAVQVGGGARYASDREDRYLAALSAVGGRTAEPVRLNGAPMPTPVVLAVRFR